MLYKIMGLEKITRKKNPIGIQLEGTKSRLLYGIISEPQ